MCIRWVYGWIWYWTWVPKDAGNLPTKGQPIRFSRMYLLQRITSTPWHTKPHMSKLKQEMKVGWQKYVHSTVYSIHLCDTTGQGGPGSAIFTVSQLCCILFGSTPWMGNSTVARPLPKNDKTNKDLTYMNSCRDWDSNLKPSITVAKSTTVLCITYNTTNY